MGLVEKWRAFDERHRPGQAQVVERGGTTLPLSFTDYLGLFAYNGLDYPFIKTTSPYSPEEKIEANFSGHVEMALKRNGIIFACATARMLVFSEARFRYQQLRDGRPGDLFGTPDLDILEKPGGPASTTGDLLARMMFDADFAGNWFGRLRVSARTGQRTIQRMRPDWVTIITGSLDRDAPPEDTEVIGYVFQPGGPAAGHDPVVLLPEEVAHFAPIPDPSAEFRGMSWITPIVTEVMGDNAATSHKLRFFENAATPNLAVTLGNVDMSPETFEQWVQKMEFTHAGSVNAYKTLYMAAGADAKVIGADLKQIEFKAVQGAGETRIAAAAGISPVLVGLSEGLQGSSLNAGNYNAAKRAFADGRCRPYWRNAAGSLTPLVNVPAGARLWYDDRDIPYLQEDRKDAAEIQAAKAQTIRTLTDAGYDPDTVVDAVEAEDFKRLRGAHAGLFSVQLQPPGSTDGNSNGSSSNGDTPAPEEAPTQ